MMNPTIFNNTLSISSHFTWTQNIVVFTQGKLESSNHENNEETYEQMEGVCEEENQAIANKVSKQLTQNVITRFGIDIKLGHPINVILPDDSHLFLLLCDNDWIEIPVQIHLILTNS